MESSAGAVELLRDIPLFRGLTTEERVTLAQRLQTRRVDAGTRVCRYGDPGGSMFILRAGEAEVYFNNDTGERIVLERCIAGSFFGEVSLLDGGARTASVVALSDLELLTLDRPGLEQFLLAHPTAAMDLLEVMGQRLRHTGDRLRHTATRNVNEETEDLRTPVQRVADAIAAFSGSIPFLLLHVVWFALWIALNIISGKAAFDSYPFGLLTMTVSLEAIFLSVFVLISQNRQAAKDRVRSDIEYDINLKAELEIAQLHRKVDNLRSELLARLAPRDPPRT